MSEERESSAGEMKRPPKKRKETYPKAVETTASFSLDTLPKEGPLSALFDAIMERYQGQGLKMDVLKGAFGRSILNKPLNKPIKDTRAFTYTNIQEEPEHRRIRFTVIFPGRGNKNCQNRNITLMLNPGKHNGADELFPLFQAIQCYPLLPP